MNLNSKKVTIISHIFLGVLWVLGILVLLSNAFGLWTLWHLTGFGFYFYVPIPVVFMIVSLVLSCVEKKSKLILINSISSLLSVGLVIFTFVVSTEWFW